MTFHLQYYYFLPLLVQFRDFPHFSLLELHLSCLLVHHVVQLFITLPSLLYFENLTYYFYSFILFSFFIIFIDTVSESQLLSLLFSKSCPYKSLFPLPPFSGTSSLSRTKPILPLRPNQVIQLVQGFPMAGNQVRDSLYSNC